jgi:hypothetical protein
MHLPTPEQALDWLAEGEQSNPGAWGHHSRLVGQAAQILGTALGLEGEAAFVLGVLHDIGRREGVYDMLHVLHGWRFLNKMGYPDAARICITHSYPIQDIHTTGRDNWDGSAEELAEVEVALHTFAYNDYDRLIQVCDCLADGQGYCLMEQRFVDVALRRGIHEYTLLKWSAYLELKAGFEQRLGVSLNSLLPHTKPATKA